MLTNEKALYQVKLILDCLPKEEYNTIPQDVVNYVENNWKYDESITIDPTIPLEAQNIDKKTYDILETILKRMETNKSGGSAVLGGITTDSTFGTTATKITGATAGAFEHAGSTTPFSTTGFTSISSAYASTSGAEETASTSAHSIGHTSSGMFGGVSDTDGMLTNFQKIITEKEEVIAKLADDNQQLVDYINGVPTWIRKVFMKDVNKMLGKGK